MPSPFPIEDVLSTRPIAADAGWEIGRSRGGRPIRGFRFGGGSTRISLIGGCHADEPVGPWMLRRLVPWLAARADDDPWLRDFHWSIVPHANPDGDAANEAWSTPSPRMVEGFDLRRYVEHRVRELPGDDVEFGFPRDASDADARPEDRAVADFLADGLDELGAFSLHVTFHGMAFAAGPWFLIDDEWIDRTESMRAALEAETTALGYALHDVQRHGEKGFQRIARGFCTRPSEAAMVAHFRDLGDDETAGRFRPSSMDWIRSLGGDPLTLVSEMPLFTVDGVGERIEPDDPVATRFRETVLPAFAADPDAPVPTGVHAMPLGDQMRLQLAMLREGISAIESRSR